MRVWRRRRGTRRSLRDLSDHGDSHSATDSLVAVLSVSFRALIGQVRGEERGVVSVPVEGGALARM